MMTKNEDYDDYEDEEEPEQLILSIAKDGKAEIKKESDYVELEKKDMDLIKGFIEENKELFDKYIEKNTK